MPLKIDLDRARLLLEQAIAEANDPGIVVSDEWAEITETISLGPSRTLVAALGTLLLAKAANPEFDPLSLKPEPNNPRSATVRPLSEQVLVPMSRGGFGYPRFHLGATGAQPLNNQPFFRYSHLDDIERHNAGDSLDYLRTALRQLDSSPEGTAFRGLVAFVRIRTDAQFEYDRQRAEELPSVDDLNEVLSALQLFLDPESPTIGDLPLRLQAVVGGLVKATGQSVSAQRLHDPSRHAPGDVHVPDQYVPTWVAEVKARPVSLSEAERIVEEASSQLGVKAVWVVAIAPDHAALDREGLSAHGAARGVLVTVVEAVDELLAAALGHPDAAPEALAGVASSVNDQLIDMAAESTTLAAWAELFADYEDR